MNKPAKTKAQYMVLVLKALFIHMNIVVCTKQFISSHTFGFSILQIQVLEVFNS